jgi:signal transduction histidine kinase
MLPTIVETVAQALKLPYVAIALKEKNPVHEEQIAEHTGDERFAVVASWGSPVDYPPLRLPLAYGHETIGEFIVAPRARGEDFALADRRLLEDLARQTEVAAYAVRLTDDLQRARERLVSAREEERRRLRRDLHDGLGPQLSGQALTIDAIRSLLKRDPAAAEELLVDLKAQTRGAAADIRCLVYALRPPASTPSAWWELCTRAPPNASGTARCEWTSRRQRRYRPCQRPLRWPATASPRKPSPTWYATPRREPASSP